MDGAVGIEAADEADVVHAFGDVRKKGRHFAAALAVLFERTSSGHATETELLV
jgi:hypothetical protein